MADADLLHDAVGQSGDVDHLAAQPETAGLQAGDVEQLGDQAGDAVGVVLDLFEHRPLLVVVEPVPPVEEERGVPLDRRERRPQLMRDGRDDLDAAGGQRVATVDRPQGQHDTFQPAAAVAPVAAGHRHPHGPAVAGQEVDLLLGNPPHPGEQRRPGPPVRPHELAVARPGLEHLVGRGPQEVLGRTGEQLCGGVVHGRDRAVGVEDDHRVGEEIHQFGRADRRRAHGTTTPIPPLPGGTPGPPAVRWRRVS